MSFVIFDTEYTSWHGCQEHGWHGKQKREIVQISAVRVSNDLRVLGTFNVLCKPVLNPVLSDYFVGLTGITNEQIKRSGVSFQTAYKRFKKFVNGAHCVSHGYGGKWSDECDGAIINENLRLYNMSKSNDIKYHNISAWLVPEYRKIKLYPHPKNSGKIAKSLGMDESLKVLGINEHNAMYDSYSILMGLKYFSKDIDSLLKKMN
ncbi:MAG: exonuclease domain-containing protein [Alphaproteobacteria bacterium]|nr:exonuclease domain-containing protein [Alphaproteobacteria bacterium]